MTSTKVPPISSGHLWEPLDHGVWLSHRGTRMHRYVTGVFYASHSDFLDSIYEAS